MYIIALLFDNDKRDEDFKIVGKQTTKDKLYTIKYPYPTKGTLQEKQAWYRKLKNYAKFYKNEGSAIRLINRLEKEYNVTGYQVIDIDDDVIGIDNNVTKKVYDGCPNCGSFDVIETFSTQYNRSLQFDLKTQTMKYIGESEDTGFGTIDHYECSDCGYDLSNCTFNFD